MSVSMWALCKNLFFPLLTHSSAGSEDLVITDSVNVNRTHTLNNLLSQLNGEEKWNASVWGLQGSRSGVLTFCFQKLHRLFLSYRIHLTLIIFQLSYTSSHLPYLISWPLSSEPFWFITTKNCLSSLSSLWLYFIITESVSLTEFHLFVVPCHKWILQASWWGTENPLHLITSAGKTDKTICPQVTQEQTSCWLVCTQGWF